jgi:hypothetical protein
MQNFNHIKLVLEKPPMFWPKIAENSGHNNIDPWVRAQIQVQAVGTRVIKVEP